MAKTPAQRAAKHGPSTLPPATARNTGTARAPARAPGNANLIVIAGMVASLFLFWYFHLLTLNQMTQLSNGLAMPDSLVLGFGRGHIEALRAVMDGDALGQLHYVHKTAGTLFPLVFAFSTMTLVAVNVARKRLRWILWLVPVLFAVAQLWANVAIDSLLSAATLDGAQVGLASGLVIASWALLVLSLAVVAVALVAKRKPRRAGNVPAAGANPVK